MDEYDRLKLALQSALVGVIPENLCAVTCGLKRKRVSLSAYFDGSVGHEEQELMQHLVREILGDFSDGYTAEASCYSVQERAPHMLDFWAFLRAESRKGKSAIPQMTRARAVSNF